MNLNKTKADELFNSIYKDYYSAVYKYCLSRLNCDRENADDCIQETFLVLYNKLVSGENIDNPRAFLYSVSTNFVKKCYNRIQHDNETFADFELAERRIFSEEDLINRINFDEFESRLNTILNDEESQLYNLRFIEEMRVKDIAQSLGISERYCSMKITRLRRKIMSSLKEYY